MLVQVFETLMQASAVDFQEVQEPSKQSQLFSQSKMQKLIEQTQVPDFEPANPPGSAIQKLITEAVSAFVESLIVIFDHNGLKLGQAASKKHSRQEMSKQSEGGPASKMPLQSSIGTSSKQDSGS